jgi:hypothetical protein
VQAAVNVFFGDRNHQAEVGLHQVFLGALGFGFAVADNGQAMAQFRQGGPGDLLALLDFALQLPQAGLLDRVVACL